MAPAAAIVTVRDLTKTYRTPRGTHRALDGVSLDVARGEVLVLLGPSGCGKSTLLRCVAGLEQPDAGEIVVDGTVVFSAAKGINIPPEARGLGMVFQSYALWPHMSVAENIAYPLRNAGHSKTAATARVAEVLDIVALGAFASSHPGQLSGGQQQRIALARAIAGNDPLILFDEPLSNLDARVRERLRLELATLRDRLDFSALYVTHDQAEALALADRIAVMDVGRVAQIGMPRDIYERPVSRYVANFVGSTNELDGTVVEVLGDTIVADVAGTRIRGHGNGLVAGQRVRVLVRPEALRFAASPAPPDANMLVCTLRRAMFLGGHMEYELSVGGGTLLMVSMDDEAHAPGSAVPVRFAIPHTRIFPRE